MIGIHKDKLDDVIKLYQIDIDNHIKQVKSSIRELLKKGTLKINAKNIRDLSEPEKLYLSYLRSKLKPIVLACPNELERFERIFDKIIPLKERKKKSLFKPFKNELIKILGYEILRSDQNKALYPKFYKKLGIKTCVYCNSQLTVTAEQNENCLVARFQVDHFKDKASYPCFSISFFNLYPVCASCNNKKGNKNILFQLYPKDSSKSVNSEYTFVLDKASLAEFRLSRNEDQLKIRFEDHGHGLNEHLAVQGIYDTQKDLAAEIIVKAEIYNQSYKEGLQKSFSKLYGKKGIANIDFNRFIIGNYIEPKDIHKRPMAKFTQDIARQLKLIPK